jgi:hypothetical protein
MLKQTHQLTDSPAEHVTMSTPFQCILHYLFLFVYHPSHNFATPIQAQQWKLIIITMKALTDLRLPLLYKFLPTIQAAVSDSHEWALLVQFAHSAIST